VEGYHQVCLILSNFSLADVYGPKKDAKGIVIPTQETTVALEVLRERFRELNMASLLNQFDLTCQEMCKVHPLLKERERKGLQREERKEEIKDHDEEMRAFNYIPLKRTMTNDHVFHPETYSRTLGISRDEVTRTPSQTLYFLDWASKTGEESTQKQTADEESKQ
jgi:hypothetical protein